MEITWPPFTKDVGLLDHPATEKDMETGRAAFVMRDDSGQLVGSPVRMGMSRLGFVVQGEERRVGVVIQIEMSGGQVMMGVRHADDILSICSPAEFHEAPRYLVFYKRPGYGLAELETALARESIARQGDVLAVQAADRSVVYIRHAAGPVVQEEAELLKKHKCPGLAESDALFEVSFLNFEEVYDNEFDSVQCKLRGELTRGYAYWGWNGTLEAFGD